MNVDEDDSEDMEYGEEEDSEEDDDTEKNLAEMMKKS